MKNFRQLQLRSTRDEVRRAIERHLSAIDSEIQDCDTSKIAHHLAEIDALNRILFGTCSSAGQVCFEPADGGVLSAEQLAAA